MAYTYKRRKEPYLTEADRKALAAIDHNTYKLNRKFKVQITLSHPTIDAEICIICYGKDKEMLKEEIAAHYSFFQKADKKWKLIKTEILKGEDTEDQALA